MQKLDTDTLRKLWADDPPPRGTKVVIVNNGDDVHWGRNPGHQGREGFIVHVEKRESGGVNVGHIGVEWREGRGTDNTYDNTYEFKSVQPFVVKYDKLDHKLLSKVGKNLYTYDADAGVEAAAKEIMRLNPPTTLTIVTNAKVVLKKIDVVAANGMKTKYRGVNLGLGDLAMASEGKLNDYTFGAIKEVLKSWDNREQKKKDYREALENYLTEEERLKKVLADYTQKKTFFEKLAKLEAANNFMKRLGMVASDFKLEVDIDARNLRVTQASTLKYKTMLARLEKGDTQRGDEAIRARLDSLMESGLIRKVVKSPMGVTFLTSPMFMKPIAPKARYDYYGGEFAFEFHKKELCSRGQGCYLFGFKSLDYKQYNHPHATEQWAYVEDGKLECIWGCPGQYKDEFRKLIELGDIYSCVLLAARFVSTYAASYQSRTNANMLLTNKDIGRHLVSKTYNDVMNEYAEFRKGGLNAPLVGV